MGYKVPLHINTQEDSGTANTGSLTITKPTGLEVDDLMLATFSVNVSTITPPAGWTQYDSDQPGANAFTGQVFYKVATSGDVAAGSFNFSASSTGSPFCGAISAYRYVDTSSPIHTATQLLGTTADPVTSPSITITVPCLLVHVRNVRDNSTTQITFTASGNERQEYGNNGATVSYAGVTYDSGAIHLAGTHTGISITGSSAPTDSVTRTIALTAQTLTSSDTASGTEGTPSIAHSRSDTGSGTEGTSSITQALSGSDTGSGTEAQSLVVNVSGSDTGSGADTGSVSAGASSSDTGSSTESHSILASLSGSDTAVGNDSGSVSASGGTTPSSSDTGSGTESYSIVATLSSSDSGSGAESQNNPGGPAPVEIGDYVSTLVMGPATIYVADFGALEPADADVATAPSAVVWKDVGGTFDGVMLVVKNTWEEVEVVQNSNRVTSRLKRRRVLVETSMAEPTLINLLYAVNSGTIVTGSGYESYSPPFLDRATPLTYRAVMVDGWTPGLNGNRHKRRRVILRKCLSVEGTELAYTADKLTTPSVTWAVHRVDGSTPAFKVIDEV